MQGMFSIGLSEQGDTLAQQLPHIQTFKMIRLAARLDALEIEKIIDQIGQAYGFTVNDRYKPLASLWREFTLQQELGEPSQARQRRSQLMADRRDELVFQPLHFFALGDILAHNHTGEDFPRRVFEW